MIESDVIIFDSMNNQLWGMPGSGWTEEVAKGNGDKAWAEENG